ncbi:MAG: UDP-2,3-diacylglucosamine diphosphatase [Deltaproteobacteria bacterium]|nr:UDP-2,3-diacylglucosamine diphosphatase [Deltaproteobacteria bacterium]
MKIVFVADGHLKGPEDPNQIKFVQFLDKLTSVNALVVLGDLFEFWTGSNDVVYRNYLPVLEGLARLKSRGADIIYLEGNHDFSMGSFFKEKLKAGVYPDSCEYRIDGKRFLLLHGDTVSMTFGYSLWRSFLRSIFFRLIARALTPNVVWRIAMRLSSKSRKYNNKDGGGDTDRKLRDFAGKILASGLDGVICAHSHIAAVNKEKSGIYANPGSWAGEKSHLIYENGAFRIEKFKE